MASVWGECMPIHIAQLVTKRHAKNIMISTPELWNPITYMDDSIDSTESIDGGITLYQQLNTMLISGSDTEVGLCFSRDFITGSTMDNWIWQR